MNAGVLSVYGAAAGLRQMLRLRRTTWVFHLGLALAVVPNMAASASAADATGLVRAEALRQGAVDFLTKCAPDGDLLEAVGNAVLLDGCQYARRGALAQMQSLYGQLSPRECEVFAGVVAGQLNKQIAGDLGIALRTVKLHRTQISRKLRMPSVPEWIQLMFAQD